MKSKTNQVMAMVLSLLLITNGLSAGFWDSVSGIFSSEGSEPPPQIKVLIVQDQPGVILDVQGKYSIFDPNTEAHISTRIIGKRKFIRAMPGGLKWGEEFPGVYQLKIKPEESKTPIVVNGVEYRGSVYIYDVGGNISIVNEVDLEQYLASTLLEQFEEPLPKETLAAIAIVARTNAYYRIKNPKNPFWAVDAEQVGYEGHVAFTANNPVIQSVVGTRYMVLSRTGKYEGVITPFAAQWGSGTGGQNPKESSVFSRITMFEAEEQAKKGYDAAQILSKAFPNTHIELVY